jgi:hypothetical protein
MHPYTRNYRDLDYLPNLKGRIVSICDQIYTQDFTSCQNMFVLIREEIIVNPFKILGYSPFRLNYDPKQTLDEQGFSKVYDCGSVGGFVK